MANEWRVKQYFRNRADDSSIVTFTSVADGQSKIGLTEAHTSINGSPTTTYALADSDQTLVATFEFDSEADQTTWYDSMNGTVWYNASSGSVEYFRVEWLHQDGTVSSTTNF